MTQWNPVWKVEIDGVAYTTAVLANLSIRSGRTNIYEQAQAGYVNLQLLDVSQAIIPVAINSTVSVSIKDTSGAYVAIFGGNVVDIGLEVLDVGSTLFTQTYSITALGALARLPKIIRTQNLARDYDGDQIYAVLSEVLYNQWQQVAGALTWATYDPTITWATAENNGLGEICIARGLLFRALEYFTTANSLAHDWETPWFNKGRAYEALGNTRAAEVAYERTIDLAPGNTWAFKNLARMYRRLDRNTEAMTLYLRAIRVDTTDVECYYGLAELYEEKGDNWRAADIYNRAVDKAPDDPKAYSRAGRANMLIGNFELAIEFLSEVVQLQPEKADAHNTLGEAYRAAGDTVQARRAFEEAVALDSLFTLPLRNLGAIMLKKGKEPEGLEFYFRAARLGDAKAEEFLRSRGLK